MERHLIWLALVASLAASAQVLPTCTASPETFDQPPVFFDDFSYTDTRLPHQGGGESSVFGELWWPTSPQDSVLSRGWLRMNRYDVPGRDIRVRDGRVILGVPRGSTSGTSSTITTAALHRTGTYVTRIWLEAPPIGERVIQAFWLKNPGAVEYERQTGEVLSYSDEIDMEFNAYFGRDDLPRMDVSSKVLHSTETGFDQADGEMSCVRPNGTVAQDCLVGTRSLLPGRWLLLAMTVTNESVSFSGLDPADGLWVGSETYGEPLVLRDRRYVPHREMATIFSVISRGREDEGGLSRSYRMEMDWFAYSPCTSLSLVDLAGAVEGLRDLGLARVNTSGRPTRSSEPERSVPHTVTLFGPDSLAYDRMGVWRADATVRGSRYKAALRYRYVGDRGPEAWRSVAAPAFALRARRPYRSLEIEATFTDARFPIEPGRRGELAVTERRTVRFVDQ